MTTLHDFDPTNTMSFFVIRCSGVWQLGQTVSIPNTRRSRSDHLMYLGLLLGLSLLAKGGAGSGAGGTTRVQRAA